MLVYICRGASKQFNPKLRESLIDIKKTCDTCEQLAKKHNRFRVTMPREDQVFNRTVGMYTMNIKSRSLLHVVDKDTKFSAATFLKSKISDNVWEAFVTCWVVKHMGFPDTAVLDQER